MSSHKSIDSIGLNGETIRLSGGINAIIGDNGSGKSFLWSKLTNSDIKKYKELKKSNDVIIHFDTVIPTDIFSVRQGEVQEAIQDGKLIPDGHSFVDINHDLFDGSVND
ncbi:hypothetical protein FACS1894166_02810 [Bacilli bacterium]|nr:hypothetical protein FACS1894166_02810 [Bacilli bacterium]